VLLVGLLALMVQGALARVLPPPWCPDLAWLVVVALGLRWPNFLSGLGLAVLLGFAMDLVSGSLMGQHALMRLVTYLAAALAARQLDLSGVYPVSVFVFVAMFGYGLAIVGTLSFFVGSPGISLDVVWQSACHALVNVLAAMPVLAIVERLLLRFSEEDLARRSWPMGLQRGGV
jgi:rod shape-determining protein MreD